MNRKVMKSASRCGWTTKAEETHADVGSKEEAYNEITILGSSAPHE